MRHLYCFLLLCGLAAVTPFASADTYSFSGILSNGTAISANFNTTPDPSDSGVLDITAISGEVGSNSIIGLVPSDHNPNGDAWNIPNMPGWWMEYDNLLYPTQVFDDNGVIFQTASGLNMNLYLDPNQGFQYWDTNKEYSSVTDVTLSETPEPSSLLLFGSGVLFAGLYVSWSRHRGLGWKQAT